MATSLPPPQNNPPDPEVPQPAAPAPPPAPQKEFVDSAGGAAIGIRTKRSPPTENPTPVAPAVNPEVPQPTTEFGGNKKADPDIVDPVVNPEVPQPTVEQNFFVDAPTPVSSAANPEVPQPQPVQNFFTDRTPAPVENYFTDETPIVQNFFTDATPAPVENFFTDETPIVQNFFTDATPVSPASNPQVPEPPIVQNYFVDEPPIVQNYFTDATPAPIQNFFTDDVPVNPGVNPQVPNIFSSIGALLSSLFGIRPTPVSPAANPQVARAIPVPTPVVFTPRPIPPVSNPQVAQPPIVQNFFTDATPAPVENFFTDTAPAPIVQNFFTDATPVSPTSNPEVPQPTQDFGGRKKADPDIVDPVVNPEVPQPAAPAPTFVPQKEFVDSAGGAAIGIRSIPTKIDGPVDQATFQQANPPAASAYDSYVVDTQNKIVEQQTKELEATQGFPVSENQIAVINGQAFGTATIAANVKFKDNIEAARAAPAVPADTPPPTVAAPAVSPDSNAQVPNTPTKIAAVSSETLLQNDPETAREYTAFKTETAAQLTAQRIAEREAAEGGAISVSEQAEIARRSERDATTDANIRYQDQIQAAGAATVVPADTPPPTVTASAVSTESNPQVPVATGKIADFSFSELALKDPDTARSLITDQRAIQQELANQQVAEYRAATGTAPGTPIPDEELTRITVETDLAAKAQVQTQYQDQILAAGAGTLVPTDTPPPTITASPVDSATNQQVPPAQTGEALIDPDTGEVLGYVDTATGDITDAPPAVSAAANPQVPSAANTTVASVSQSQLAQTDSALYNDYNSAVATNTAATEEQLTAQALATYGVTTRSDLPLDVQLDIREQALTTGVFDANTLFKDQLEASGAATTQPTGTPPPTVAAAPPSPSPYEVFLAQEAAATDAAQAEATARFNAQFDDNGDIIASADDPQAFPVDDGAAIPGVELEPVADDNSGYADFFGTDADFDVGEFQAEPSLVADDNSGYADFFGTDADFNVGEFQAEPAPVAITDGYLDFNAADAAATAAADDIGEFQAEPDTGDGESAGFGNFFGDVAAGAGGLLKSFAGAVSGAVDPQANSSQQSALDSISGLIKSAIKTPNQLAAERQAAAKAQAKAQAQVNAQRKQANEGDWRVRLRLAGGADYLYKAKGANGKSAAGILEPLAVTDGVIFPYTPQITTQYTAKYNPYELTHSNYKGYFYQSSAVNEINLVATFTAQDTSEANYLLAVIHFFRSVTKMFYGQDDASKRGAPPPLVFLQGLGEYQFNLHPCVVQSFNYVLPNDCDYIRANSVNFNGNNLLQRRDRENLPIDYVNSVSSRLSNAGLTKGGLNTPPAPPTLGTNSPTYVPTKMEMTLVLLPMQTRSQISQQFSLKQFANGDLIRGGFW